MVVMILRESIEQADKKLEKLGFDNVEKAIIFYNLVVPRGIVWLLTASKKEINDWYDSLGI
jgi:hypothetical protein